MKTKAYILLIFVGWFTQACNPLEEDPLGLATPDKFYRTEADALAALTAAYNVLSAPEYYNQASYLLSDIPTDDAYIGVKTNSNWKALEDYSFDSNNEEFRRMWLACFVGINRANAVIDRVPLIDMDTLLRSRIVAEARFLRALHYFNLVRYFGGVPLVLKETTTLDNIYVSRNSVNEVYSQIISDLEAAETALPATYPDADKGRATNGAATAMLAKVYLTQENWTKAAEKANQVITSGQYQLLPSYRSVWLFANQNSAEHIFSVQRGASSYNEAFFPVNSGFVAGSRGISIADSTFYKSFSDLDYRKTAIFYAPTPDAVYIAKYYDKNGVTASNFPVIRYAEILLIYAEALNELQPGDLAAYDAINQVRKRARFGSTNPAEALPDLNNLTQEEFRAAVWQERRWELSFEGQRWFDLVRTKQLVDVMHTYGYTHVDSHHLLYPIPQRERSVNPNLGQNTGYQD